MPELKFCGCLLMREHIVLRKVIKDEHGNIDQFVEMGHDYYHLIDKKAITPRRSNSSTKVNS